MALSYFQKRELKKLKTIRERLVNGLKLENVTQEILDDLTNTTVLLLETVENFYEQEK